MREDADGDGEPARDRLARTLRGEVEPACGVALTASTDDLSLDVEGVGPVAFPVRPAQARELLAFGQPARFGRGEETLTDRGLRDTSEIPKNLVRARWDDDVLDGILTTAKEELGLPIGAELTADLHSLLGYEPGQFLLVHQGSGKDDSMIGTMVVTLPSGYTGGELVVCHLEVREVRSGYRIALTFLTPSRKPGVPSRILRACRQERGRWGRQGRSHA